MEKKPLCELKPCNHKLCKECFDNLPTVYDDPVRGPRPMPKNVLGVELKLKK